MDEGSGGVHRAALIVMYGASMVYRLNTDVGSVSWMIWSARGVVCDGISSTLYISLRYVLPLLKFFTITDLRVGVDRYLLSARHSSRTGTSYPVKPRLLPLCSARTSSRTLRRSAHQRLASGDSQLLQLHQSNPPPSPTSSSRLVPVNS